MNPFDKHSLQGVLPDKHIKTLLGEGIVSYGNALKVNSSSLDTSLSGEIYEVRALPVPRKGQSVRDLLKIVSANPCSIDQPIEPGRMYIVRLNEQVNFSEIPDLYSYANPKSTTGRDDIFIRLLANGVSAYDTIPHSYKGDLWGILESNSFRVQLGVNHSLNQLRFFTKDTRIQSREEMGIFMKEEGNLLFTLQGVPITENINQYIGDDGSILLPIDLESEIVGYEALVTDEVLDFSAVKTLDYTNFFRPIMRPKNGLLFLKKGHFYLLSCGFASKVPFSAACEMRPIDDRIANARVHYAGYIDDGWGSGNGGAPLTLEVRTNEDMYIQAGQPIARLVYERMAEKAHKPYSARQNSNYSGQKRVQFAKHFK
jgi:dCTP deaminase